MKQLIIILMLVVSYGSYGQSSFGLQEAVLYAKEASADRQLALLEVETADARITEFKSIGLPQISAGVDYTYYFYTPVNPIDDFISPVVYNALVTEFPNEVEFPQDPFETFEFSFFTRNNLTARVDGSMLLFDGSYLTGLRAAKLFKELRKKKIDIAEEEITATVTKAYMNVLIVEENKKMLAKNLSSIKTSLKEAQAYYDNGFIEQLEVKRLTLSQETIESELSKIEQLISINKELLKFQMSYPMQEEIILTEDLDAIVNIMRIEDLDLEAAIDYTKKAQYLEIEMGDELNDLNIERLKKGYLPSVLARAGANESLQRNNLFDSQESNWLPTLFLGLSVNVPITDGKLKSSQIQQAEIESDRIALQKQKFERGIDIQVKTTRLQYNAAKESLTNAKRLLELNEEVYDITKIKFREGVGSSIEVTQAENALVSAQAEYITALYQLLITKTDLDITLGNL